MDFKDIIYRKEDGIAHIIINRPEKRNALNRAARLEMMEALGDAENDMAVKVLILSGAGEKSFMAGSDLNELSKFSPLEMERFTSTLGGRFYTRFEQSDKPVIAMIDGLCLGGGLELALACDIRIASNASKFGQPEMFLGIMPGSGGTQRLPRLVGPGKAKELILTGKTIDATEALRIGLVNQVVSRDGLEETVMTVAKQIAKQSPLALKWAKKAINMSQETGLGAGIAYETLADCLLFSGKDREEGMKAFFEKRKPQFKGE
ncbi:MAG: enoyl-CoA hydratase/isomerase family protein [Desulfobacterales bacterium]|nr:enoyl-CoA hydratase/isomerase family protein [Desulfobacterales bacterium]